MIQFDDGSSCLLDSNQPPTSNFIETLDDDDNYIDSLEDLLRWCISS